MALVRLRRAAQLTLPQDIREAAKLKEGDYLEAEVTPSGAILLKPVSIAKREPTPEQDADILDIVDGLPKGIQELACQNGRPGPDPRRSPAPRKGHPAA